MDSSPSAGTATGQLKAKLISFPEKFNRCAILLGDNHDDDDSESKGKDELIEEDASSEMMQTLFASTEPLEITIILDLSYSMSHVLDNRGGGYGYRHGFDNSGVSLLKKLLCKALVHIHSNLKNVSIKLWGFSNDCFEIELPKDLGNYDNLCRSLSLQPRNATNFGAVHVKLQQTMMNNPGKKRRILMFTDGCDTSSAPKAVIEDTLKMTKDMSRELCKECKFIVLGFTSGHDAAHLTKLAAPDGNFYYVRDQGSLEPTLANISEELTAVGVSMIDVFSANQSKKRVTPELLDDHLMVFVRPSVTPEDVPVTMKVGDLEFDIVAGSLEEIKENSNDLYVNMIIALIRNETVSLSKALAEQHNVAFADVVSEKLDDYQKELDKVYESTCSMDLITRKECRTTILTLRQTISNMRSTLAQIAKDGISDERLANISSFAFQNFQTSVRKTMDKRALANQKRIQTIPKECHRITQSMDLPALKAEYESRMEDVGLGSCILTTDDVWEALEDGGHTMFLGFQMERRHQSTVQEPTLAVVKSVSSSFFRSDAAQNAIEYRLSENSEAHGGFLEKQYQNATVNVIRDDSGDYITVGNAREPINAWLPLDPFARVTFRTSKDDSNAEDDSDTHKDARKYWHLAKKHAIPILGWMYTTDPLGFSYKQMLATPFLVLRKLLEKVSLSELNYFSRSTEEIAQLTFDQRLAGMVLGTCVRVWQEYPKEEKATIIDLLEKNIYINNRAARLRDNVISNSLLAIQWYVASVAGDIDLAKYDMDLIVALMIEEELRRWTEKCTIQMGLRNVKREDPSDPKAKENRLRDILSVFNVSEEDWTGDKPTDAWLNQQTIQYAAEFLGEDVDAVKQQVEANLADSEIKNPLDDTLERKKFFKSLASMSKRLLQSLCPSISLLHPVAKNFDSLADVPYMKDPMFQLAMVLQNQSHGNNKAFREAVDKSEIIGLVGAEPQLAEKFLLGLCNDSVEKLKKMMPADKNPYGIHKRAEVYVFCNTRDLRAAAGVLTKHPGGGNWGMYIVPFRKRKDIPHYAAKVSMMMTGEFEGKKFRTPSGKFEPWKPSKRNAAIFKYSIRDIEDNKI